MLTFLMIETTPPTAPAVVAVCIDCGTRGYCAKQRLMATMLNDDTVQFLCPPCYQAREIGGF